MPEVGRTISHYRILDQIGQGGMGEVYLADDTTLDRKVALKFLPEAFTSDPERMARFEREAKLLASLNHPNIAGIYGLEQAEGNRYLVLEYVEGETLQARLSKGALPLEDALLLCRQVAEGLEAAHEKGVIHRDLKPANVMIAAEEKVKILDFGLAKALSDETQSIDSSQSPTLTEAMTQPGVILGTAAYMSPEQTRGKSVDKRADIWAFGCILYECLAGKRAFAGETVTETLAAVIKEEPDLNALPASTPLNIRFVLQRCLDKDRNRRFRNAADVQIEIEETRSLDATTKPGKWQPLWLAWSFAALFLLAFTALSFMYFNDKSSIQPELKQLNITLPDQVNVSPEGSFAISPDGRYLAFAAQDSDGVNRIWIRELGLQAARPLPGTGSKSNYIPPFFWSPDSRFVAYDAGGILMKVDISGRPPVKICDLPGYAIGGTWNRDDVIVYPTLTDGLMRVSIANGIATPLTRLNKERQEAYHLFPVFLPDDRHFLYLSISLDPKKLTFQVCLGSLDAKPEEQVFRPILESNFMPVYVPSQDSGLGHILFLHEQTLMALPFDEKRLEEIGEPVFVAEGVGSFMSFGFFSASTNGTLVYRSGVTNQWNRPAWFDRKGNPLGIAGESGQYYGLSLSPSDSQAAVGWRDMAQVPSFTDIWLLDLARNTSARLTFGEGNNPVAIWSPDGSSIIFASDRDIGVANLYQKLASGVEKEHLLFESKEDKYPSSWASDGNFVLFNVENPKTKGDLWVLRMEDKNARPLLETESNEIEGRFSENMLWIAYQSDKTGRNEIYVREFSQDSGEGSLKTGGLWQISRGGGTGPRWGRKDKELYFHDPNGTVMVAEITPGSSFHAGTPKPLFQAPPDLSIFFTQFNTPVWDVTRDGDRFLLQELAAESSSEPFAVVLNWTKLLEQ